LLVTEPLVVKHQHGVAVDRLPEGAHSGRIERAGEINLSDLADE